MTLPEQYRRGFRDFLEDKDPTDCPYSSARSSTLWYKGWTDAFYKDEERRQREGYNADRG